MHRYNAPVRVGHFLRPAAGGMVRHVADLSADPDIHSQIAAPSQVLANLRPGNPTNLVVGLRGDPFGQARDGVRLARWLRKHRLNLLHSHGIARLPASAIASRLARVPWVVTYHNLLPTAPSRFTRLLIRILAGRATQGIAVSQAVAASLDALLPRARCSVVHNGIDTDAFAMGTGRSEARRALGWDDSRPVVLCVARLAPEKGIGLLEPLARDEKIRLVVAGDGPERPLLAAAGFELLGERTDVALLMAASDCVVVPSLSEGLGLVAIEAGAASRPVVATQVGGLVEVIEHETTGILVPSDNAPAIVEAVRRLVSNPTTAASMGDRARQRVETLFSRATMWEKTRDVYDTAVRR